MTATQEFLRPTRAAASPSPAQKAHEYLSFHLGAEEYGIDILKVQEIRGYEAPTRMAGAPAHVKGVINLRGVIVPIVDLRIKFSTSEAVYEAETVTIVVTLEKQVVGLVVDSVSDVVALHQGEIKPVPGFSSSDDSNCFVGLGTIGTGEQQRLLVLMDVEKLLTASDISIRSDLLQ